MEARLRTHGAMRIVQGPESRPSFTPPLDSGERRELRDYDAWVDSAAGEIWNCREREQQTHLVLAAAGLRRPQWPMSSSMKSKDFSARHSALPMLGLYKPSAVQYCKPQH